MRRTRWISGILLTGVAAARPTAVFAADTPGVTAGDATTDLARLQSILTTAASSSVAREEAARRMIAREGPEARAQVRTDLQQADTPVRLALLNAVATATAPDPELIRSIGPLLGGKAELTRDAALALAHFHDRADTVDLLIRFADDATKPPAQRAAVIVAMGSLVDQRVARDLMSHLQDPREAAEVRQAITDALGTMTGLDYGSDTGGWVRWWSGASSVGPDRFAVDALRGREKRDRNLQFRLTQLSDESKRLLERNYLFIRDNLPNDADATLLSYLNSSSPEIRGLGASQDFSSRPPSDKIKTRLREMIGDSDDAVRRQVVEVVLAINDKGSVEPLLAQLEVERDSAIKKQLVRALGKIEDKTALPALMKIIHGPDLSIAVLAAQQISGALGEKLQRDDPSLAAGTSADLRKVVDSIENNPADNELRAACMQALATLHDQESQTLFRDSLKPGETVEVQTAAICGLGNLGDTKDETLVSGNLDANDRGVRLAAAIALQQIATPESANTLNAKLKSETDPEVRDALWRAFRRLFPLLNESELNQWANVFTYDPAKRLDILVALAEKLAKSHNDSSLAATNQDIAEGYMRTNQPAAAIVSLQKAIDYWQQKNTDDGHLYAAITDMLQYQFKAGKYADAVAFGEKQISLNGAYEQPVVGALKQEAESLISGAAPSVEELANARVLATGALKYPNLSEKYRNQLQQILDSILQKQAAATAPHG